LLDIYMTKLQESSTVQHDLNRRYSKGKANINEAHFKD